MFEFKCISREAFEKNPHFLVFFQGKFVVTIWQAASGEDQRSAWSFVGNPDFIECSEEFDTAEQALQYVKQNWALTNTQSQA